MTKLKEPPRLDITELVDLARNVVTNVTFITNEEHAIESAFIMTMLVDWTKWETAKIGALYEDYNKAGPRSINGYPFFMSFKMLHVDDLEMVRTLITDMQEALK